MPFIMVIRWLTGLATTITLLFHFSKLALAERSAWHADERGPCPHTPTNPPTNNNRPRSPEPLQWRSRWWVWQLLSGGVATLTAPTLLITSGLLMIDSRSDHPLFWWSLPAIIAISNTIAILRINQQHQRQPFIRRGTLSMHYVGISMIVGCTLFLLVGWVSDFLPDLVAPMVSAGTRFPALSIALWSTALAGLFGILSFVHAGALHGWIGFRTPVLRMRYDQPFFA